MKEQLDTAKDRLLTQKDVAVRWKCSVRKLQRLRANASGPSFVLLGGSVRYILSDILAFEKSNRVEAESA